MELKPGYRRTGAGVIPEDWELRPLMSTVRVASGQVDPRFEPYRSMVLIAPDHIESRTGKLIEERTAADQRAISGKYLFDIGDVIYSKIRPYLRKAMLATSAGLCSADMYPLKPAQGVVGGFILPVVLGNRFSNFAETVSVRSGIPKINREELAEFDVALPPLSEQRAIATALSDVDSLLSGLDQLIAKKRDLKQAAMQQLLTGKQRLPGFSGEWVVKRLGEIGESYIGLTYSPNNVRTDGLLVLRSSNVFEGTLRFDDNVYVDLDVPEKIRVKEGDILICARNGSRDLIGKCALVDKRAEGMTFGAFMAIYRSTHSQFVYQQFRSDPIKRQIHEHLGATINQITNKSLNSFKIHFPRDEVERNAIVTTLSDMDIELAALEQRRDKTRALKQGMMQELLTGRIRLV